MPRRALRAVFAFLGCATVMVAGLQSCGVDPPPYTPGGGSAPTGGGGSHHTGGEGPGGHVAHGGGDAGPDAPTCADPCQLSTEPNAKPGCCAEGDQCCRAADHGYSGADLCHPLAEPCPVACPDPAFACPVGQYCKLDPVSSTYTCESECEPQSTCGANVCCPLGTRCKNGVCPLPDLSIDGERAKNSAHVIQQDFAPNSCEEQEGCIGGPGERTLLYFDTKTPNMGAGNLELGQPFASPLFEYSPCHQHFHFKSYAGYRILDANNQVVATGHKQAFCLEDISQVSPNAGPGNHTCQNQGVTAGWADVYWGGLPCQWVDVTGVPPGDYFLEIVINGESVLAESDYTNNSALVPVTIPWNSCPQGCKATSETCCKPGDPCGWGGDGSCDCGNYFSWDAADCSACPSTSNACKANTCPGGCTPNQGACCAPGDPCGLAGNGACDCGGIDWDAADCANCITTDADCPPPPPVCEGCQNLPPTSPSCGITDPENWADDGWCDCPTASWDAADCAICDAQGCP
jgi:hypothetical protein